MTTHDLLHLCATYGVVLTANGDRLQWTAPKGVVTPKLLGMLKERKPELLVILGRNESGKAAVATTPEAGSGWVGPVKPLPSAPWWLTDTEAATLPDALSGLVVARDGWTPEAWRDYLRERARRCDGQHRDVALLYLRAADLLDSPATGRRNCSKGT